MRHIIHRRAVEQHPRYSRVTVRRLRVWCSASETEPALSDTIMKFALFTVSCPSLLPSEVIADVSGYGYDGLEWRVTRDRDDGSAPSFWKGNRATLQDDWADEKYAEIAAGTRAAGLEMPSLGTYVQVANEEAVERALHIASIMGVAQLRVCGMGGLGTVPEARATIQARLGRAIRQARPYGVRLLVEIHHNTLIASASAARAMVEPFAPEDVGVIHDCGNMVFEGFEEYDRGLGILGPYLAHVHAKSAAPSRTIQEGEQLFSWQVDAAPLRQGQVDFSDLFRALRGIGYDGWVTVEDFSTSASEAARLEDNIRFLRAVSVAVAESATAEADEAVQVSATDVEAPIRCGVVGLGRMGWSHHVAAIREHAGLALAAVYDMLPERREEACQAVPECRNYEDYPSMLADPNVELVFVCTPSHRHEAMTIAALAAGKHVLCEEPAALAASGVKAMIAARKSGQVLTFHHNDRLDPEFLCVRELVDSGLVGDVFRIRRRAGDFNRRNDWQTLDKYGGGVTGNWGLHPVDQGLEFLSAPVDFVWGQISQIVNPGNVEDDIKAMARCTDGKLLDIVMSSADASVQPSWVVLGTRGTIWVQGKELHARYFSADQCQEISAIDQPWATDRREGVTGFDGSGLPWQTLLRPVKPQKQYDSFYDNLYKAIRHDEPLIVTPESTLRCYQVLDAIKTGQPTHITE